VVIKAICRPLRSQLRHAGLQFAPSEQLRAARRFLGPHPPAYRDSAMSAHSMNNEDAIVFSIVDPVAKIAGYTWLIEWTATSFYIKSTYKPLQMAKISLHGPDPKHIGKQHFRLDFDHPGPAAKAVNAGGGWSTDALQLPLYFKGRQVNKRTVHIVRFSAESGMYEKCIPTAPNPVVKQKATLHAIVAAPPPGKVTHVDVFLSNVRPYWENETKARKLDAGMGPIVNSAGMFLTAINYQRPASDQPDPFGDIRGGVPLDQCVRGIAQRLDPSGFLWVCEKMIPRSAVGSSSVPPRPGGAPPTSMPAP
jgi:hypothetical protein